MKTKKSATMAIIIVGMDPTTTIDKVKQSIKYKRNKNKLWKLENMKNFQQPWKYQYQWRMAYNKVGKLCNKRKNLYSPMLQMPEARI